MACGGLWLVSLLIAPPEMQKGRVYISMSTLILSLIIFILLIIMGLI